MRIGEEAQVEHQIRGARYAPREGEGCDRQDGLVEVSAVAPPKLVAQLGGGEIGGVEHIVRRGAKREGEPAFARDAVFGRPVGSQRVQAASLVVAPNKLTLGAIEIDDLGL